MFPKMSCTYVCVCVCMYTYYSVYVCIDICIIIWDRIDWLFNRPGHSHGDFTSLLIPVSKYQNLTSQCNVHT